MTKFLGGTEWISYCIPNHRNGASTVSLCPPRGNAFRSTQFKKLVRFSACCIFILTFNGCATWTKHGVTPSPQLKYRIAILPVQATVKVKKISDIQTVPAYVGNQDEMIHAHIRQETEQMTASLESHLNKSNFIEVVPVRAEVEMPNDQDLDTSKSWSIEDIEKLGLGPGTQAVLSVNQIIECWNIRTNRPSQGTGLLQLKYL